MTLFLFVLAGVAFLTLVWAFTRYFLLAWAIVLALNFLGITFGTDVIGIGAFHVAPYDLLLVSLPIAGLIRLRLFTEKLTVPKILILCYLMLFLVSVLRGIAIFGIKDVANEVRGWSNNLLALSYFFTAPAIVKTVKKVVLYHSFYAAALVLVCIGHYAGLPIGGTLGINGSLGAASGAEIDRALPAAGAATLAVSLIFTASWAVYRKRNIWLTTLITVLIPLLIILQHRSVWAMLLAAACGALFLDRPLAKRMMQLGSASLLIAILYLAVSTSARARIAGSLHESATNTDTLAWRFEGWERLITEDQSPFTMLLGLPMGSGYLRLDSSSAGEYIDFQPHNEFVADYLRVGILGAVTIFVFMLWPVYMYFQSESSGLLLFPTPASWCIVAIALFVYAFPYGATFDGMALIAMANALFAVPREQSFAT